MHSFQKHTLSSSECSSSQREYAESNILFHDGKYTFHDSWTCHIKNCTLRQRIIQCNSARSACMDNWSCQQCISGGTDLQCQICAAQCSSSPCYANKPCYSYFCSDALRAYQCYYAASFCYAKQETPKQYTVHNITEYCKECALNDQDVKACFACFSACKRDPCWYNCSMSSHYDMHSISLHSVEHLTFNTSYNASSVAGGLPTALLTPNAIYGIMAMVGLVCLIFGFWCGKNCSAHSLSKACCKYCVFWCDDDRYSQEYDDELDDEFDEESAWNWKQTSSVHSDPRLRYKKKKRSKNNKQKQRGSLQMTEDDETEHGDDDRHSEIDTNLSVDTNEYQRGRVPLNKSKKSRNSYGTTEHRIANSLRLRFPLTPLSTNELPGQQNVEQSPDVRVAHFQSPDVRDDIPHAASFGYPPISNNHSNQSAQSPQQPTLDPADSTNLSRHRMQSLGSDEEDAPPATNSNNNNNDDANKAKATVTRKYFNELNIDDGDDDQATEMRGEDTSATQAMTTKKKKKKSGKKKKKRSKSGSVETGNPRFKRQDSFEGYIRRHNGGGGGSPSDHHARNVSPVQQEENETKSLERSLSAASKKYSKDDMVVSSSGSDNNKSNHPLLSNNGNSFDSSKLMRSPLNRVTSADSVMKLRRKNNNKEIIVLKSSRKRVVSPPPIQSKSEFQMLCKPVQSADGINLKKRSKKQRET